MSFAHLDDDTLDEVRAAAIRLGFADDAMTPALTAGINPAFVAFAAQGGNGLARLTTLTARLNQTRVLVSGEVPFKKWLKNAVLQAGGTPEELVFRGALEQISTDGAADPGGGPAPASTTSDVQAVPRDNGALEITIEQDDTIDVGFLHSGSQASRSVAKLMVHRHFGGAPSFVAGNRPDVALGTGWLVAPRLLVTNHHVVNARAPIEPPASAADFALQGAATTLLFDFFGSGSAPVTVGSVGCLASDATLDYALLRLPDDAPARVPLRLRSHPILKPQDRALGERVNVLQHPNGDPMRLGFRNNFVVSGDEDRLSYLTDTAGGSSGSPICDDAWFAAALHRGFATLAGDGVVVWGKQIRQENYGTPVTRVLAHLGQTHPDLFAEITAAQAELGPPG